MNLKSRLRLGYLSAALLPLALVALLIPSLAERTLRVQTAQELTAIAELESRQYERFVEQNFERLALIASRTQLRISLSQWLVDGDAKHLKRMRRILDDAGNSIDGVSSIHVHDPNGQFVLGYGDGQAAHKMPLSLVRAEEHRPKLIGYLQSGDGESLIVTSAPLLLDGNYLGELVLEFDIKRAFDVSGQRLGFGATCDR